jgi:hypothetical protein
MTSPLIIEQDDGLALNVVGKINAARVIAAR